MKPEIITQIEAILDGQVLTEAPKVPDLLTGLMVVKTGVPKVLKYVLDETRQLIGLNLAGANLDSGLWEEIVDLIGKESLAYLQALNLSNNQLEDISFSDDFKQLKYLNLSQNESLSSLIFEEGLPALEKLTLYQCALPTLQLPGGFDVLENIEARSSQIKNVLFKQALPKLEWIDLSGNSIRKLEFKLGFEQLKYIYLQESKLEQLKFEEPVPSQLNIVNLSENQLKRIPEEIIFSESLEYLNLSGNRPKNVPDVFLENNNCLEEIRPYFQYLPPKEKREKNKVVKLKITGNGTAGKTTLLCSMQEDDHKCIHDDHYSTHGIEITTWNEDEDIRFHTWDFGGQEIYYGTHQLFMSSPAIQLILFDPDIQQKARDGLKVPDSYTGEPILPHTLSYWYESIKSKSSDSQFLFVQNNKNENITIDQDALTYVKFKSSTLFQVDAKNGEGVTPLIKEIKSMGRGLPEYDLELPPYWVNIRQYFIDNEDKGNTDKNTKLIDKADFDELCEMHEPNKKYEKIREHLKKYLHHAGYIYCHEYLGDKIIADQKWALEAIYKPLDRKALHYKELQLSKGQVTVSRLFELFGEEYEEDEKWLLLEFMRSCGLCFKINHRPEREGKHKDDIYLFPQFLGEKEPKIVTSVWSTTKEVCYIKYKLSWLDYPLILNFTTKLGSKTDLHNIWKNGIYFELPEGKCKVWLDIGEEALMVAIETAAMPKWLSVIIDDFSSNSYTNRDYWQISYDGETFEDLIWEKWNQGAYLRRDSLIKEEKQEDGKRPKLEDMEDVIQYPKVRPILLFVAANPLSENKLHSQDSERKDIKDVLGKVFDLEEVPHASLELMHNKIDEFEPPVIHFSGHGEFSFLCFHNKNRTGSNRVDAEQLKNLFADILRRVNLKLIFLNACNSERIAAEISKGNTEDGIYTIGISDVLFSKHAIPFARNFYSSFTKKYTDDFDENLIKRALLHSFTSCKLNSTYDIEEIVHAYYSGKKISLK